jgi:hypothetical protein
MAKKSAHIEGLIEQGVKVEDDQPDIQLVSQTDLASAASDEKFMHEDVTVVIMPTTDPNAPPYAVISVNGDRPVVIARNNPTRVKRKVLEVLARMKETRWLQSVPEGYTGQIDMGSLRGHTGFAYPFTVLEDKNPKGAAWLANIMAEPS